MKASPRSWWQRVKRGVCCLALGLAGGGMSAGESRPAPLTIVDPGEAKGPAVQTSSESYRQRFAVQLDTLKPGAKLRITSATLLGPDGVAADVSLAALGERGPSLEVTPPTTGNGAVVEVDLSARLPRLGDYTGYVTLRYGDDPAVLKLLHVQRTLADLPVEVLGTQRVPARGSGRTATVSLTLQGPPDRTVTVTPTVAELALNRTGKEPLQAQVARQSVRTEGPAEANNRTVTLNAGEAKSVVLELAGFAATGEYAGKARLTAPGFKPKDQAFIVVVKDVWWWAAIPILLGAGISLVVRRYGSDQRPRLIVRQRIAELEPQLATLRRLARDDAENRVLEALGRQLVPLQTEAMGADTLPANWSADAKATLQRLATKLPVFVRWCNARRLLAALDPASNRQAIETRLAAVEAALGSEGALTDAVTADLAKLPGDIANLRRDTLLAGLQLLESEFDKLRAILSPQQLSVDQWTDARAKLDRSRQKAQAGDFDGARAAYDEARDAYARMLLEDFATRLAAGMPVGLEAAAWNDLKPRIEQLLDQAKAATDVEARWTGYARAYGLYLQEQIRALLPKLEDSTAIEARTQKLAATDQQPFRDTVGACAGKLREAAAALTRGELRLAYENHLAALGEWRSSTHSSPPGTGWEDRRRARRERRARPRSPWARRRRAAPASRLCCCRRCSAGYARAPRTWPHARSAWTGGWMCSPSCWRCCSACSSSGGPTPPGVACRTGSWRSSGVWGCIKSRASPSMACWVCARNCSSRRGRWRIRSTAVKIRSWTCAGSGTAVQQSAWCAAPVAWAKSKSRRAWSISGSSAGRASWTAPAGRTSRRCCSACVRSRARKPLRNEPSNVWS